MHTHSLGEVDETASLTALLTGMSTRGTLPKPPNIFDSVVMVMTRDDVKFMKRT